MANELDMLTRGENQRRNGGTGGDRPFGGLRKTEGIRGSGGIKTFGLDPAERKRKEAPKGESDSEDGEERQMTETQEQAQNIREIQRDAATGQPKSLMDLGDAWEQFGDVGKARRAREMGVERAQAMAKADPENPQGLSTLADAWDRLGQPKRADKARRMAKNVFDREFRPDPIPRVEGTPRFDGSASAPDEAPRRRGNSGDPGSPADPSAPSRRRETVSIFN